ncbi:uncharacterized protein LOC112452334 [Temnothorax curvispinosus]|uniref:Uncharacterized protein LOC112452334 n=1 Tax=Temnothorax curvispinosus TaxID=300111 RepID=A0A6J1PFC0_9HYME|nr:uncharacterized protein LOC112452334 [Temnothorax curvispinosus]
MPKTPKFSKKVTHWKKTENAQKNNVNSSNDVRILLECVVHLSYKMEKKVYCVFGERCKCIRYVKQSNEKDVAAVKRALLESTATDTLLLAMMKGKSIVLQKQDPDRNNRLRDIDDDEDISDKEEISILFIALPEQSDSNTPATARNNLWENEPIVVDIPVVYPVEPEELSPMTEAIQVDISDADIAATKNQVNHAQSSKSELGDSSSSIATGNISPMHRGARCAVPYPAHLPQLTPKLQRILETVGVFHGVKDFIYFWASYLLDITDNQPTKQDYQNLAVTIVETYPSLKGGTNGCGIVVDTAQHQHTESTSKFEKEDIKSRRC